MSASSKHAGGDFGPGDVLGRYRLVEPLGEGAVGIVFRAVREPDGESVAVKILKRELRADDIYRRRFEREARIARTVRHENIVRVLEHGEVDGRQFLAAIYFPGRSLRDRIAAEGPLPLTEAVAVVAGVSSGLDALHRHDLVHRDIKSSNVILDASGRAALTDFGLAKGRAYTTLTREGQIMGTIDYLAPELFRGGEGSAESDIYALGCLAFECFAGAPPFAGKGWLHSGVAHLEEEPPDPCARRNDCPASVAWAIIQALAKDASRRPRTATAYANLLKVAAGSR
jgi:serine/threonine protein kinase